MPSLVPVATPRCVWCHKELAKIGGPYEPGYYNRDNLQPIYKAIKTRHGYEYWDKECWEKVRKMKRSGMLTEGELKVLK